MIDEDLYKRIEDAVDSSYRELKECALQIHQYAETALEEHKSTALFQKILKDKGFIISPKELPLETAFIAEHGSADGKPVVALTAEMDALSGMGHACGHNLIGSASVFAAAAAVSTLPKGLDAKLQVIGTPAEERYSGKVDLIKAGAFDEAQAVLQFHPANFNSAVSQNLAVLDFVVEYHGRPSHAAAAPHKGVNALDALIQFFNSMSYMRQQFAPGDMFHGIIQEGGKAVNIIPDYTKGAFYVRSTTTEGLYALYTKSKAAAEAAAAASGCSININEGKATTDFQRNATLEGLFEGILKYTGKDRVDERAGLGSSDIANVSKMKPTIEYHLKISDAALHTHEFMEAAKSEEGIKVAAEAAKALAYAAVKLLSDKELLKRAEEDFKSAG